RAGCPLPAPRPGSLSGSLSELLEARYGRAVYRHDRRISAITIDAPHAELLEMPVGAAALFATQLGFDRHGHRLELGRSVYRGDKFDFTTVTFSARRSQPPGAGTRSRTHGARPTTPAEPVTEQAR